jgi:hypothetical protein
LTLEVRQRALQLDELRLAKGSPTGAAVEHHQGAPVTSSLVERYRFAVLVRERDVREVLPDGRTDVAEVDAKIRDRGHALSFSQCRS